MQFELRRRNADGLAFQTSYVFGKGYLTNWETWRQDQFWVRDAGTPGDGGMPLPASIQIPSGMYVVGCSPDDPIHPDPGCAADAQPADEHADRDHDAGSAGARGAVPLAPHRRP